MSILNGNISSEVIHATRAPFGESLDELELVNESGGLDCTAYGELLICGEAGSISIYRVDETGHSRFLSRLSGIGAVRQLCAADGFVYATTREDGVFICDIRDVTAPKLAYQIDSIELATGIDAAGGILAITNRHMCCELYDIRKPDEPKYLESFLCGEAQSVRLHGRLAIIGDWMNKQVRIFSIGEGEKPRELSRYGVDGFADGVFAFRSGDRDLCLCATGHHSAGLKNRRKYQDYKFVTAEMLADGWGGGHGIEIFDITEPSMPEFLSCLKAPPIFGGLDTWRVFSDGKYALFTDSMNGLFILNLEDPLAPYFEGFYRPGFDGKSLRLSPPVIQQPTATITGAAVVNGYIAVASAQAGFRLIKPNAPIGKPISSFCGYFDERPKAPEFSLFAKPEGQTHSFTLIGDRLLCACGDGGIVELDRNGGFVRRHKTPGICCDIAAMKGFAVSAEGIKGLAVYRVEREGLHELSRLAAEPGRSPREVIVDGKALYAELGSGAVGKYRLSDEGELSVLGTVGIPGLLYHRHAARTTAAGNLCVQSLSVPVVICGDRDGEFSRLNMPIGVECCPFADGICGKGDRLIGIYRHRYFNASPLEAIGDDELRRVPGAKLDGTPFVIGEDRLVILNRYSGRIELLDLTAPEKPRLVYRLETEMHPEFAELVCGRLLVACGHDGIIELPTA